MNRFFIYVAALAMSAAMLAPQGLSAQQRVGNVVKVQGHVHELLTRRAAEGKWSPPKVKPKKIPGASIDPGSINCWINEANLSPTDPIDSAYLIIKFTDGKYNAILETDSVLVWGYRYNSSKSGYTYPHHSIDMLRAVANNDTRLTVLLQYASPSGHSIGGIGYSHGTDEGEDYCTPRVPVIFDYDGASKDKNIAFSYTSKPNCDTGQVAVPVNDPSTLAKIAIDEGYARGVIDHPFNVYYGYPAYDYDYWILNPSDINAAYHSWQAGWMSYGYWAFYVGTNRQVPTTSDYAANGITYQLLNNQEVHGFVFNAAFGLHDFSGELTYVQCCPACFSSKSNVKK
jgi:hypothetical protein